MLLELALLSLIESIRKDQDRYNSLIYHNNTSSNTDHNSQNYEIASHGQRQYPSQDYTAMIFDEAGKLFFFLDVIGACIYQHTFLSFSDT